MKLFQNKVIIYEDITNNYIYIIENKIIELEPLIPKKGFECDKLIDLTEKYLLCMNEYINLKEEYIQLYNEYINIINKSIRIDSSI